MTKNKYGFKTVNRDAKVGDRILNTACGSNEVYNKGAVFTVTEADVINRGDVRVKEYIGSKDWFIDRVEYEVIIEEDAELTNINYGYKTERRLARVGERIVITDKWVGEDEYENGAVFTVRATGDDGSVYAHNPNRTFVMYSEYEVIVGNADDCDTVVVTLADGTRIEGTPEQAYDLAKRLGGEEVEESKVPEYDDREMSFIRAGRKVDEIEEGDIVEIIKDCCGQPVGTIGIVEGGCGQSARVSAVYGDRVCTFHESVKLIAPVSARVDVGDSDD